MATLKKIIFKKIVNINLNLLINLYTDIHLYLDIYMYIKLCKTLRF